MGVPVQHVLHLPAVVHHTFLKDVEDILLDGVLFQEIFILKHIEAVVREEVHEGLVDLVLRPEKVDLLVKYF